MIKVYIASPYTLGDVAQNVRLQIDTVDVLMNKGFLPFAPLYSHFQHMVHPRPYTDWLKIDFEWIKSCDCILRLVGESSGADAEVKHAIELNIPVFYSIEELCDWYNIDSSNVKTKVKNKFLKKLKRPFFFTVGLIGAIALIGIFRNIPSLGALILYLIGWFRLTDLSTYK